MTSDRVKRQHAQKEKLKVLRENRVELEPFRASHDASPLADAAIEIHDVLESFSTRRREELNSLHSPVVVSFEDVDKLLTELHSRWDKQQVNVLLDGCRKSVLSSIVGPFGLGNMVAALDKNGGNVTTIHNAKQGIYADQEDAYNRSDYVGSSYKNASDKYKDGKIIENSQMIQDEYTGEFLDSSQVDCDHIKPVKQYHQEGGFMQSKKSKEAFGSDEGNFAVTSSGGNRSLGAKDKKDWQAKPATDGSGKTNKEVHGHDNRRVNAAIKRGEETAKKHAPTNTQKNVHYSKKAAVSGVKEAGKMGLQQSMGLLLTEFFAASFDEIADSYKNGLSSGNSNQGFFEALKVRLLRVSSRVAARWSDALIAFKDGAISGFLSNLVTMLINMLITTGKRIVRVIREGFMSILKALKMAMFPPKGMALPEALDAALKLLAGGVIVSLGILGEEVVEKTVSAFFTTHMPLLSPYVGLVSTVIVGAMTGIASALVVYGIDKLDLFGVNSQKNHERVMQELDQLILQAESNIDVMMNCLMVTTKDRLNT